ncbi:MAG: hypothetical protein KGO96_13065 [Elusimicrobia bacterium]|nr:hypothetical protein [Elusimicrobiota bacterium]MDE2426824.1 hypothetical protein [Elusimicrobiota bacterium]
MESTRKAVEDQLLDLAERVHQGRVTSEDIRVLASLRGAKSNPDRQQVQPLRTHDRPRGNRAYGTVAEGARQFLVVSLGFLGIGAVALAAHLLLPAMNLSAGDWMYVTFVCSLPIDVAWVVNIARRLF